MSGAWLLGAFPGFVLGLWASLTPMRENEWTLLALFGVGAAIGAVGGFLGLAVLVATMGAVAAAGWILALVTILFFANIGCVLGRVAALLVSLARPSWKTHRALFAVAIGLTGGLITGAMFAAVTVGASALEELLGAGG